MMNVFKRWKELIKGEKKVCLEERRKRPCSKIVLILESNKKMKQLSQIPAFREFNETLDKFSLEEKKEIFENLLVLPLQLIIWFAKEDNKQTRAVPDAEPSWRLLMNGLEKIKFLRQNENDWKELVNLAQNNEPPSSCPQLQPGLERIKRIHKGFDLTNYNSIEIVLIQDILTFYKQCGVQKDTKTIDVERIYESKDWVVFFPKNWEESRELCGGTNWCIGKSEKYYSNYFDIQRGSYLFVLVKKNVKNENEQDTSLAVNILAVEVKRRRKSDTYYDTVVNYGNHATVNQKNQKLTEETLRNSLSSEYSSIKNSIQNRALQHLQILHPKPLSTWEFVTQILF